MFGSIEVSKELAGIKMIPLLSFTNCFHCLKYDVVKTKEIYSISFYQGNF